MQLVAGMLSLLHRDDAMPPLPRPTRHDAPAFKLVSWRDGAHTRREDELARQYEPYDA